MTTTASAAESALGAAVSRRHFLKVGLTSAVLIAIGAQAKLASDLLGGTAIAAPAVYDLAITDAMVEMVDLTVVYHRVFADASGAHLPGPSLHAFEGDEVQLRITNVLGEPHAFAVHGTSIGTGPIAPGATATLTFTAPSAGTYIYLDPSDAPVNRLLGLHGTLVVLPRAGRLRTRIHRVRSGGCSTTWARPATSPGSRGFRSAHAPGTFTRSIPGGMPRRRRDVRSTRRR